MPEQSTSSRELALGPYLEDRPRPSFLATRDGDTLIIELDSSAVFLATHHAREEQIPHILNQKRAIIRAAAERLIDRGFFAMRDGAMVVVVSALDI